MLHPKSGCWYSIYFEDDCWVYYRIGTGPDYDTDDSFRVSINSEVREVLSISSGGVGIGTTVPTDTVTDQGEVLAVAGIVTAHEFYGDGSGLTALNASNLGSGTFGTARIADDAVTFDKLEDVANSIILGRVTAGAGNAEELTTTQVRTLINVSDGANNYSLPTASSTTLGGIKVGTNLSIAAGVLSADAQSYSLPTAS